MLGPAWRNDNENRAAGEEWHTQQVIARACALYPSARRVKVAMGCRSEQKPWIVSRNPQLKIKLLLPGVKHFFDCGWYLLNHGVAQRMRLNLGNLNPFYERELIKLGVDQKVEGS